MNFHAPAARSDSISYIPVRIDERTYVLTTVNGCADVVARPGRQDSFVVIWLASKTPPTGEARDVLETAGFAIELSHGRAR